MVNRTVQTALRSGRRNPVRYAGHSVRFPVLVCAGLMLGMAVLPAGAEPIVVLEYRSSDQMTEAGGGTHPFRMDPDYSAHHKVRQDETLSHIIANYYGGSGLDTAFVQMAIVKKNRSAFVRSNPNYLYAGKSLHLPSLNEIRAMLVKQSQTSETTDSSRDNREHIFFFGS